MTNKHQIGQAFELAFAAHRGQTDKAGEPYITHLVRVAARLETTDEQTVALLHDLLEDTDTPQSTLDAMFPSAVVKAVVAITKSDGDVYDDYLARVAANPLALQVKRADIADNADPKRLARLDADKREVLKNKYVKALAQLSQISKASIC